VRRPEQPLLRGGHQEALQLELGIEVHGGRVPADEVADFSPVRRSTEDSARLTDDENLVPRRVEVTADTVLDP
jgi:hypothetical protein